MRCGSEIGNSLADSCRGFPVRMAQSARFMNGHKLAPAKVSRSLMTKRKKWLFSLAALAALIVAAMFIAGIVIQRRAEPYIREQAIAWLRQQFASDVRLASLKIHLGPTSPFRLLWHQGRGTLVSVEGTDLVLQQPGQTDLPPELSIHKFSFQVDLGAVFAAQKTIGLVTVDGMILNVPPKGERHILAGSAVRQTTDANIAEVIATNTQLLIIPRVKGKNPLRFDIAWLRLQSIGGNTAMQYDAMLTNPKPPGQIHSVGTFGPWAASEPGDTPLAGKYTFDDADLGVFKGIAGILHSTGQFEGTLSAITARGEAVVPDFRLKRAGNPVPLSTRFEVLVDGGNGNTVLQPVHATLGKTQFSTTGSVLRHDGDTQRTITIDADMPRGRIEDALRLAMKGPPMMEGQLALKARIVIPPLAQKVKEKLILDGRFSISQGKLLRSQVQDKIDSLSRRGQGQPDNEEISEVLSNITGSFHIEDQTVNFRSLSFSTPGADVRLAGTYDMGNDTVDFHGSLSLEAKVSKTMKGWKRWALIPVDPFFAKNGAGTFLKIRIDGPAKSPKFGLDRGGK
jgi:hypothetical protein